MHALLLTVDTSVNPSLIPLETCRVSTLCYPEKLSLIFTFLQIHSFTLHFIRDLVARGMFLLLLVSRELSFMAFVFVYAYCMFIQSVSSICIYSKGSSACMALQLCLLHVLFIDRAARDPTQASDISVRCTRQFKGSDQEIDCGSEGGMREKHELGRNILVDLKVLNKLVSSPCFPPLLH